jgi:hypothetical protein
MLPRDLQATTGSHSYDETIAATAGSTLGPVPVAASNLLADAAVDAASRLASYSCRWQSRAGVAGGDVAAAAYGSAGWGALAVAVLALTC